MYRTLLYKWILRHEKAVNRTESTVNSHIEMRRINCPSSAKKVYMPPYRSTIAQMLRTPIPCPDLPDTGIPSSKIISSPQELIICKKSFLFFSYTETSITPARPFFPLLYKHAAHFPGHWITARTNLFQICG